MIMKRYCLIVLLALLSKAGLSQGPRTDYSEAFKLIEVWLDAQRDYERLPGITAAVIHDQDVLWTGAFGLANAEDSVKAEPSTIFSICSISKLFTSVAIMKLYEEGKLRLDDGIDDLLPWYDLKQKYPESGPITIRSLLTHSSGLPREADIPYWTPPDFCFPSREQVKAALGNQETLYPASTVFQYSNIGMALLGEVVAQVSGMPYDEYIERNILRPLGLNETKTTLPESLHGTRMAVGYSAVNRNLEREKVSFFQPDAIRPAAGFSSTVLDLGKFASWQFRLLDTTSAEVLKPSTLKYMHNVHWTDPDWNTTWGLGFVVTRGEDGNTWIGHGGECPGYRTLLQLCPKTKMAISIMINANSTNPGKYAGAINAILAGAVATPPEVSSVPGKKSVDLRDYTGYYSDQPATSEQYISTWGGDLVMLTLPTDNPAGSMVLYRHIGKDTFRRVGNDGELRETLVFERDTDGRVFRYKTFENYVVRINRK
jgi:CubicO group peptidase (beta-lactamase class C family)